MTSELVIQETHKGDWIGAFLAMNRFGAVEGCIVEETCIELHWAELLKAFTPFLRPF